MPLPDPKDNENRKLDEEIRPPTEQEEKPAVGPADEDEGVKPLRKEDITPPDGP